ncbi:catalase [Planctomicrobium piriforme]|uniref:Catalase n=1 Tax=Planctomicrobium piriforme TaxID=1576369 RepID=A0A1I3MP46_9PLAN|nr:catalase [Planctomicrobium piriforme]SFI98753.1 catalase [Planctomicrobium piriforme]
MKKDPGSKASSKGKLKASNAKVEDLSKNLEGTDDGYLSTNQGLPINDNQNSLKAGERGPSLLEDFILREKITHFDHERIPERIVHARGSGAHGVFQVYESMAKYTRAGFLQDPAVETPVFVRFSTVAGSRGSTDLARDVRGFAVKFYTEEGNFDLVGNNMPVFFIQDAMKFPDLIHAVKPEPHNEIPQAASAHDTFWDFISLTPESAHMIMWVMSDRAIPRSLRMMEGFGIHTFRLINQKGVSHFVKFHWKPLLGMHSVLWDEALRISGCDPDFHRRDLWEAIENGDFPEWELGFQIIPEKDEHKYDFDLLDPTKLVPEDLVPVQRIGKMTLNRNPDNFFAEVEQVAFHPGHLVPGIDFTNDPLLQGRLFSYTDTQLIRLGGPNFHEIPINRPVAPLHNHQRDGHMRQMISPGRVAYEPNSLNGNAPLQAPAKAGGFVSYAERVDGAKLRAKSPSFSDHFSQAAMFYHSQSPVELKHIVHALRFELGKCDTPHVRERMLFVLSQIDEGLASDVAQGLGIKVPTKIDGPLNLAVGADAKPGEQQPKKFTGKAFISKALSMLTTVPGDVKTRKVAALVADGFDDSGLAAMKKSLTAAGAMLKVVGPRGGTLKSSSGKEVPVDFALPTTASVLFDAVYVCGGEASTNALSQIPKAVEFVEEAFKHCKAIAATGSGIDFLQQTRVDTLPGDKPAKEKVVSNSGGVVTGADSAASKVAAAFIEVLGQHRVWEREDAVS